MKQKWQEPKVEDFKIALRTQGRISYHCTNCGKYFLSVEAFRAHQTKCDKDVVGDLPECPNAPDDGIWNGDCRRVLIS